MILLQQSVGFLVCLWFFVRSLDVGINYIQSRLWAWSTVYLILAFLFLLACLIGLGFHA
jgi:predicted Na+-dependent transporter